MYAGCSFAMLFGCCWMLSAQRSADPAHSRPLFSLDLITILGNARNTPRVCVQLKVCLFLFFFLSLFFFITHYRSTPFFSFSLSFRLFANPFNGRRWRRDHRKGHPRRTLTARRAAQNKKLQNLFKRKKNISFFSFCVIIFNRRKRPAVNGKVGT